MEVEGKDQTRVLILGSGTSTGVPMPTCSCSVCTSAEQKNKRLRTSLFLQTKSQKNILVDATPDLRAQVLNHHIKEIDGVIITHDHADHVHGIDDLRPFSFHRPAEHKSIPLFSDEKTLLSLKERFPYIFNKEKVFHNKPIIGGGIPHLQSFTVSLTNSTHSAPYSLLGEPFYFYLNPHGYTQTLGFRYHHFAYFTDCHHLHEAVVQDLKEAKLDLLIIDCIKRTPHATHLHLEKTLSYIERINPQRAGLIHLSHDFDHSSFARELHQQYGDKVFPLFDGQILFSQ